MWDLQPPRHISTLPNTELECGQPWRRPFRAMERNRSRGRALRARRCLGLMGSR